MKKNFIASLLCLLAIYINTNGQGNDQIAQDDHLKQKYFQDLRTDAENTRSKCVRACVPAGHTHDPNGPGICASANSVCKCECGCQKTYDDKLKYIAGLAADWKLVLDKRIKDSKGQKSEPSKFGNNNPGDKLTTKVPDKLTPTLGTILNGNEQQLTEWSKVPPAVLTTGFTPAQVQSLKELITAVLAYNISMTTCFKMIYDQPGGDYLQNNGHIIFDEADEYYRDNAFRIENFFWSDNYNFYYSGALVNKCQTAYSLYKIMKAGNYGKENKKAVLEYIAFNNNLIYKEGLEIYRSKSVVADKKKLADAVQAELLTLK